MRRPSLFGLIHNFWMKKTNMNDGGIKKLTVNDAKTAFVAKYNLKDDIWILGLLVLVF